MIRQHRRRIWMSEQPFHISVVPRVAVGRRLIRGPMVLGMQDRGLLPEGARQFECGYLALPIREGRGEVIDDPWAHRVLLSGSLVGE